jgi:hypothetical protein
MDLRAYRDYFPIQHYQIGFITETESVYCSVWTGCLYKAYYVSSLKGISPLAIVPLGTTAVPIEQMAGWTAEPVPTFGGKS